MDQSNVMGVVLKKLSAVRATLNDDEQNALDSLIVGAYAEGHGMLKDNLVQATLSEDESEGHMLIEHAEANVVAKADESGGKDLVPYDKYSHDILANVLLKQATLDHAVLKAIRPILKDRLLLVPRRYQAALVSAQIALYQMSDERDSDALEQGAELLEDTLALMELVAMQRSMFGDS